MKFMGRERELDLLNQLTQKSSASLAVIYGRRRVGKTRLIEQFVENYQCYSFAGLHPDLELSSAEQLQEFATQVELEFKSKAKSGESPVYNNWSEAFYDLAQRTRSGRVVIVFDEITWLANKDPHFLGKLKIAWDKYFKKNPELILIICGSVSAWIHKNILSSTGFHGRISLAIRLRELPLSDCHDFWGGASENISGYEKLKLLAVMGGIPKYLEEISGKSTAEENIKRLAFSETGILFNDFRQIFSDSLYSHNEAYRRIVMFLAAGSRSQADIAKELNFKAGGTLSDYLDNLCLAGFVTKHFAWNLKSAKVSNRSYYRLSDNYLRFYLKYILPNYQKITAGYFDFASFDALPAWSSIAGLQIENLVLNNQFEIVEALSIEKSEIICSGPYIQRKTARCSGCQIDYLVQTKFNTLYLCEVKFSRLTIGVEVIDEIKKKIEALVLPKNMSIRPVLIHVGELSDQLIDAQFFAKTIDLCSLI